MKIIVLAGGYSTERDVSLTSGSKICEALRECGHQAYLLDLYLGLRDAPDDLSEVFDLEDGGLGIASGIAASEPDLDALKASREDQSDCQLGPNVIELCKLADITLFALHGGIGEDGRLQAAFDVLGIRYTGSGYLGSALAMHKGCTKELFKYNGIPTPEGVVIKDIQKDMPLSELGLSLPVVVKPCSAGSSIGVSIAHTEEEYQNALKLAFRYENEIVIETYIKGREFACGIIDGKALPVIEIIPKSGWFDYANKYQADCTQEVCPADIPEDCEMKMRRAAEAAARVLRMEVYCRADFLMTENGDIYCLEVNTLPGMTPASLVPKEANAAGISYSELCERIITESLKKYE